MKRVLAMISLSLFPRLLVAQELDLEALAGEDWYGLYLNGQKAGFAVSRLTLDEDRTVHVAQDATFKVSQGGVPQTIRIVEQRSYDAEGGLLRIESVIEDSPGPPKRFEARVEGDQFVLRIEIGGRHAEEPLPKPKETLKDALQGERLVRRKPAVGDGVAFSRFEPMFKQEISGESRVVEIEERVLDGVTTRVYKVQTEEDLPQGRITSTSMITEDGTLLEGTIAGLLTMRLEPKEVAQDVGYSNDVLVSNAAPIDVPIVNPRGRESLRLVLTGPLQPAHLFNDDRQQLTQLPDGFEFVGVRVSLEGFEPAMLPIDDEELKPWLEPTAFVQSDDPKLVATAQEIVGEERNSLEIAKKLCQWVHGYVRTTYTASLSNALEVLETRKGDCTEHSILFIGLARAAGLPAREVAGLVYVEGAPPGFYFHQWAKVWVGKWIDMDPTFNQPSVDVTHVKLAEGDLLQQTQLIPIIGRIQVHVVSEDEKPA